MLRFKNLFKRGRAASAALAAALAFLLLAGAIPALADNPPAVPPTFYGRVFQGSWGGPAVPDGAKVEVYVGDETQPRGDAMAVSNGWYGGPLGTDPRYIVNGTDADVGKSLTFKVDGEPAATYDSNGQPLKLTFQFDQVQQVDLVLPDKVPPVLSQARPASLKDLPCQAAGYTGDTVFAWSANEDLDTAATPVAVFSASGAPDVQGVVTFPDARTVQVVPNDDLQPGTTYTLTLSGVKDKAGNEAGKLQVQFTTTSQAPLTPGTLSADLPVAFAGGQVELTLPAGTVVDSGASLSAQTLAQPPAVPAGLKVAGQVVSFTAQGINPPQGAKLHLRLKANADARAPYIYYFNEGTRAWEKVTGSTYDASTGFVAADLDHLSTYGVLEALPSGPAPTVTAVDPTNAVAGQDGQVITVTGQNFQDGAQVVLLQDGQEASAVNAVYSDSSRVTFTLPDSVPPGVYTVAVRNPDGQQSADAVALVLYAGPAPAVNVYPGAQGTQPGQVQAGGGVRVEVPVQVGQSYQNALVIIRVDDPDGKPLYGSVEGPLPANTTLKYSASFNLPGKAGTYTVKAYVWDGWQTMNPIVPASQTQFTAQ
ncbi:IPT/TIG domain protein [Moorella thermoacetica]|nr:IPT/TIG domain protein [Moorella thermoacetica]